MGKFCKALLVALLCMVCSIIFVQSVNAEGYGAQPVYGIKNLPIVPNAAIYSDFKVPVSVSENNLPDKNTLKKGVASNYNILGLVELGDSGIKQAAKNGDISTIYYVDIEPIKLWAYYFYFTGFKTTVYGE